MTSLTQSEIFFFISSIGFVIVGILIIILTTLCIKAVRSLLRIVERIESSMDSIGDATMELIEDLRSNIFFRMFFHAMRRRRVRDPKN